VSAARSAALFAQILSVADLKIDIKHKEHAAARMEVWQKGYGLITDVNGVLYVYGIKKK
jgi:hypothetical protein